MNASYIIHRDGYDIDYSGGRLADVLVNGQPVECVEVRTYDFASGEFVEPFPSADLVAERVEGFLDAA
jgi:hypothetical protein